VRIEVYDVLGRRIRTLVDERRRAGPHRTVWRGRNALGRKVASGVYFLRLRAGETTATRKVVIVR
jgi:flagellar hook assembly protein FlgD